MQMNENQGREIMVYESGNDLRLEVRTDGETVWLTIDDMARLFGRDKSVIGKHVRGVFTDGELPFEGFRQILPKTPGGGRPAYLYNLDVLISVGYRVKSPEGVRFRQWATRVLREMLLNRLEELKRIASLENRMTLVETDIEQIKDGVDYLAQQLESDVDEPHQRVGFGAKEGEMVDKPYGSSELKVEG